MQPSSFPKFSLFHTNIRSLRRNLENFQTHLLEELDFRFNIICITETGIKNEYANLDLNPAIPNYNFEYVSTPLSAGGVGMYIDEELKYTVVEKCSNEAFQALWIEVYLPKNRNIICGVVYRQHNSPERFQEYLDEIIEKLSASGKQIFLMGDTNLNLLRFHNCKYVENLILSLQSLNLTPTIDKPTRVHNNSYSLIDNIFVSNLDDNIISGNIISDLTDHFSQFCFLNSPQKLYDHLSKKRLVRDYSNYSETSFLCDLSRIDLIGIVSRTSDVNKSFSSLYNKLNNLLDKHAPLKPISKRKTKRLAKPWITKGIRRSIKVKNNLYCSGETASYKIYRNKISVLTRISKKRYFHKYFQANFSNIKKIWEGINSLLGRLNKPRKDITALKCPRTNQVSHNPSDFPDIMKKYFSSIGYNLASKMPNPPKQFTEYLPKLNFDGSFFFNPVSPSDIELEIMTTPINKVYGLYSFPNRILRSAKHIISQPLSLPINKSLENGVYPSKLKLAKVIPIYKSDDESDPSNFRPISLLSVFNRIFEKMMYYRLKSFLEQHNILHDSQYGFREKRSTEHALLDIINQIETNMGAELYSCGIFIDLRKAFDTVDHQILLSKLHHYGVRGITNRWFSSYLLGGQQTTQIGANNTSKKETILSGVPQGSVLGPLLFLIYINDISNSADQLKFYLFADDTHMLYADRNPKSLETMVNHELSNVYDWLIANKLCF